MSEEVLIVGAGPTGLTLALSLTRQGVPVRIVDAAEGRSEHSKALAVHARTLEHLRLSGLADVFVENGVIVEAANIYSGRDRLGRIPIEGFDSPYPFVLVIPQNETERLLGEALEEQGVSVEWSTEVVDVRPGEQAVGVTFDDRRDSAQHTATYPWVVGCDGARSAVRSALELDFEGDTIPQWFGLADVAVDWGLADAELHVFLASQGILGFIPLPEPGKFRLVATLPGMDADQRPQLGFEDFEQIVEERCGVDAELSAPVWTSSFMVRERIVQRYRSGRVFLAGDAAHIHSPAGGQGMNTGMQDALNLAWKLALVHQGRASDQLLDSYEAERHPVAKAVIRGTGGPTRLVTVEHPILKKVRDVAAHLIIGFNPIQQRLITRLSMLSVDYPDSPIVGQWRRDLVATTLDPGDEHPSLGQRNQFRRGPAPGSRAPDAPLGPGTRLFDLFSDTHHTLLLFDGQSRTSQGYEDFSNGHAGLSDRVRGLLEPHVIVSGSERPDALGDELSVWHDPEMDAHRPYGAGAECLYLVRPDGYIAWRSQPADFERLEQYLDGLLGPAPLS